MMPCSPRQVRCESLSMLFLKLTLRFWDISACRSIFTDQIVCAKLEWTRPMDLDFRVIHLPYFYNAYEASPCPPVL
jgi:hypothetical protein